MVLLHRGNEGLTMLMPVASGPDPRIESRDGRTDLAARIQARIAQSVAGRIRDLSVTCLENQIILQGRARTYHAKQIAQETVLGETNGHTALANQIVVGRD
jgi:hypothetical protein